MTDIERWWLGALLLLSGFFLMGIAWMTYQFIPELNYLNAVMLMSSFLMIVGQIFLLSSRIIFPER